MKLLELEIHNVRGIRHLILKPEGTNLVIWGPNGSGKSAVVDAIDFLLTGRVTRLTGKGTGSLTLTKHGPHIDQLPETAIVRGVFQIPGIDQPVEIRRCMATPNNCECDPSIASLLEPTMTLARQGQHVLTRREILKYITAESGARAQEIQELLNISEIEDIRKALVRAQNDLDKESLNTKKAVDTAKSAINATISEKTYRERVVLEAINQNRAVLGGHPIVTMDSTDLKTGLTPPAVILKSESVNTTILERDIQNLTDLTTAQNQEQISRADEDLRSLLKTIRSDPQMLRSVSHLMLTEMGIKLIDETGACPLCDTPWPLGELQGYLEKRIATAKTASALQARINELSATIANAVDPSVTNIQRVIPVAQVGGLDSAVQQLQFWLSNLQYLSDALNPAIEKYPEFDPTQFRYLFAPDNVIDLLMYIRTEIKNKYPEATPQQTAWDILTRLEENIKAREYAENNYTIATLASVRAAALLGAFQKGRDIVLGKLYDEIKDHFVSLYRHLHGPDEDQFTAILHPDGAGLNLEVDFYSRGTHPPHALHSEGHQDSMGLCLYLALAERLTGGLIDLLILDDVLMSVDADHRRQLCHILATLFPSRQFLITTHDKTWASQLRSEGVVNSRRSIEFYNWNVETGPHLNVEMDMGERIEADLQRNDVPSAASRLRRGSEQFFATVCDSMQAPVTYKMNGRWELGELLPAAVGQYRSLLGEAKKAANSWNNRDELEALQEEESRVKQISNRTQVEQWAVNVNVHYNQWASFSVNDFRPVVEAFQDLYALFVCTRCKGMLHIVSKELTNESVRCACGRVNWNLVERKKTQTIN